MTTATLTAHAGEVAHDEPEIGKLGIWAFLASEVLLFGGLFAAYIMLRVISAEPFPGGKVLNVPLAALNTFVLIGSSVTMVLAYSAFKARDLAKFQIYLVITVLCGFGFLGIKYIEYTGKFHHGYFPNTSTFFACYFTMTGLHALHVTGGIIANLILLVMGKKHFGSAVWENRTEYFGLYWHFVDIVWIFLFPIVYLT